MDIVDTADLLAGGESLAVEFKRDYSDADLVKAVTCLANGGGGVLLLGVDNAGSVVGARPRHGDRTDPYRVAAVIQNQTEPALGVHVSIPSVNDKEIIRIDVPQADPGPVGTKGGVFVKRSLDTKGQPQCLPMTAHEIVSMGMLTRGQDYATADAVGATLADLDPREFDRFRTLCRGTGDFAADLADEDLLKALGLAPIHTPISLGAVLLFGTEAAIRRWLPATEFLFHDQRKESALSIQFASPLLKAADEFGRLLDRHDSITELVVGLHRIDLPLIPRLTRREAIANALVHRDYSRLGPTTVQITDGELIVSNPGGFPPGVTVENILDESRPRSPALAAAFKRAGLVERRGKGVNEMFEQQLRAGRDVPSYARSTSDSVTVTIPLGTRDIDLVRFLVTYENDRQSALSLEQMRLVHEVKTAGSASASELAEALHMLLPTVRSTATSLVEAGVLEFRGAGRSRRFHLTARFYDIAQDRSAYVRVNGADPLQQGRMILDYAQAFGSITRSQAAELCQTSPQQARVILKRLVDDGRLVLRGERRGAHYVLPDEP